MGQKYRELSLPVGERVLVADRTEHIQILGHSRVKIVEIWMGRTV
jgi:hypothetical protein